MTLLLKKRLFSSPAAFAHTVGVYLETLERRVRNLEGVHARFRRPHLERKTARQFAARAFHCLAHVVGQSLAERSLQQHAALLLRRYQRDGDAREREDAPAERHHLHFAFDRFQNLPVHQQQLVRFGWSEHAFGPVAEAPLNRIFDFRKQAHG